MALRNRTIRTLVIPITVLLATGILFLDLSLSVGIATWLLYLLPMLFTIRARQRYYPLLFALLCTVLTGVGLLCHHSGIPKDQLELAITRRGIGVAVFWMTAILLLQHEAKERAIREVREKYTKDLETRVAERTASLQESVNFLEGFCSSIAHNLRAPLRHLEGYATLLLEGQAGLDVVGSDYARRIAGAAREMDCLIKDLLDYGRLSYVRMRSEVTALDFIFKRTLGVLSDAINAQEAEVKLVQPLPKVRADPAFLLQIIIHLVENALKFAKPDQIPRIRLRAIRMDGMVKIFIEDNGVGVAPDYQERIFGVFEQLDGTHSLSGTGIGLAFVRKGIERMNGRVGMEPNRNEGSIFWIELPAAV